MTDQLDRIRRRQIARFLQHLEDTGQLTPRLRSAVMRFASYVFEDVEAVVGARAACDYDCAAAPLPSQGARADGKTGGLRAVMRKVVGR